MRRYEAGAVWQVPGTGRRPAGPRGEPARQVPRKRRNLGAQRSHRAWGPPKDVCPYSEWGGKFLEGFEQKSDINMPVKESLLLLC